LQRHLKCIAGAGVTEKKGWGSSDFRATAGKTVSGEEFHMRFEEIKDKIMRFEEIKDKIMSMDTDDQKRLIMEVVPQVWGGVSDDASFPLKLKELVDKDITRLYDETFSL
jgi:hypothetical protein